MRRLVIAAFAALISIPLHATVLVPIDVRELVNSAPVILRGRVVAVDAAWIDGRRAIETIVTVEPAEYLRGNLGDRVRFAVPGGQLGRYRTVFVGAPVFAPGDDVVLFLATGGAARPRVVGLSQGVFRVVMDRRTGRALVTPPAVMAAGDADPQPVVRGDRSRRTVPFDTFRASVLQVLATSQAERRR